MRLIRATTAIKRFFDPEDAPDYRTVVAAVKRGDLPGRVWDKSGKVQCWIDADYFEPTGGGTGNALADEILAELGTKHQRAITQQ